MGDLNKSFGADIAFATLDKTHVVPVQFGTLSQLLLAEASLPTAGADAFPQHHKFGIALHAGIVATGRCRLYTLTVC